MLESLFPSEVELNVTGDDTGMRVNLITNNTIEITTNFFFYTLWGYTKGVHNWVIQKDPGIWENEISFNITKTDKIHFKCDRIKRSIVNGVWEPYIFSFALDKPPGQKLSNEPGINLF